MSFVVTAFYPNRNGALPNECWVSMSKSNAVGAVYSAESPTSLHGHGSCFGEALDEFEAKLNAYIQQLVDFRDEVVSTSRAYKEAVRVDQYGTRMV